MRSILRSASSAASMLLAVTLILAATTAWAEEDSLAQDSQNPIANLISVPFQNNTNFGVGFKDNAQNVLNVQPVIPFAFEKFNVITRTIMPIVSAPALGPGDSRKWGLGDTTFTAFVSPPGGNFLWGIGPAIVLPTGTDNQVANKRWAFGPSIVFVGTPGPWVVGSLFSNVWDVGGYGNNDTNLFTWQYFVNYNFPDFYLTTAPIITANWENSKDDTWTVPFGAGIGKLFKFEGFPPLNTSVAAYYNVEKPPGAAEWQLRIQIQALFPR
jgi:hypothetical protein